MTVLPTLRQLQYFVAVMETRHFGRAAEACLVTQSALSAGLHELEQLLGVQLLERTRRSVVPSAAGAGLLSQAKQLLQGAAALTETARTMRAPMEGVLHIGVIPTIGPFMLPRVLPALRRDYPKLLVYLREDQTARLIAQLESGDLDAILLALPYPLDGLETEEILRDPFSAVLPRRHKLARQTSVRSEDLEADNLLLLEDGHCLRDQVLSACSLSRARQDHAVEGTSLHTLVQMVANGLGVTILPKMALDAGIVRGMELAVKPFSEATPYRTIGLSWRKTTGRRETFHQLVQVFRAAVNQDAG